MTYGIPAKKKEVRTPVGDYLPAHLEPAALAAVYGPSAAQMLNAMARSPQGSANKKYTFIAGVIRNLGSGTNYWQPIADVDHQNTNFGAVTTTDDYISLSYATGINPAKVVSLIAVPDDTLAQSGVTVGTSVGRTETRIYLGTCKPYTDILKFVSGTGWTSQTGKTTVTAPAINTYTFTHPSVGNGTTHQISLTSGDGVFLPGLTSEPSVTKATNTTVSVQFRDYAGALMSASAGPNYPTLYLTHGGVGAINPKTVDITAYPGSNIWVFGVMEV